MASRDSSTLAMSEAAWEGRIRTLCTACAVASCALLAASARAGRAPLWPACALASLALHASNARFLAVHRRTTVGMGPLALFGLLPATCSVALAASLPPALRLPCAALSLALALLLAVFLWWFARIRLAYRRHPPVAADAALIVLGGAVRNGRPCETLARRLDVAARLWREGPRRTIVVTGGPTPDGRTTEAQAMARYLAEAGVPARSLVIEPEARNTRENVLRSCQLLDERGTTSQRCVVSSSYHLWRACREARLLHTDLTPIPAPTPAASVPQQWCREVLTILARA